MSARSDFKEKHPKSDSTNISVLNHIKTMKMVRPPSPNNTLFPVGEYTDMSTLLLLVVPPFQIIRCFDISTYITFAIDLDIHYV